MLPADWLQSLLTTDYYHVATSTDIVGVGVCVALKNAYAVGVSMAIALRADGRPDAYMHNPQAALFEQSLREMTRLVRLLGGFRQVAGIPGAGDLYVTIFGGRTRRLGYLLRQGDDLPGGARAAARRDLGIRGHHHPRDRRPAEPEPLPGASIWPTFRS